MALMVGKIGRITFATSTVGMGNWSISQPGPALLDGTQFGDEWVVHVPGVRDGGTVSFAGNFNWAKPMQQKIIANFTSAVALTTGSSFRCYMSTDAGSTGAGYFKLSTGATLIIQTLNVGQDKGGLGSMDVSMKISGGYMKYTT